MIHTTPADFKSRYGKPSHLACTWYWAERIELQRTGKIGTIQAISEMEALDRLREAFPEIKAITWISKEFYTFLAAESLVQIDFGAVHKRIDSLIDTLTNGAEKMMKRINPDMPGVTTDLKLAAVEMYVQIAKELKALKADLSAK